MQAFEGIRVLDMTHVLAGPFSTCQLAVLGADVIKIEPVGNPDMNRGVGAVDALSDAGMGSHFQSQAANKRAMTLNLKSVKGREIFRALARDADVIVENFRAGAMERLGLGYDDLRAVNPDIIYCSITGFGADRTEARPRRLRQRHPGLLRHDDRHRPSGRASRHGRTAGRGLRHRRPGRLRHRVGAASPRTHRRRPADRRLHAGLGARHDGLLGPEREPHRRTAGPHRKRSDLRRGLRLLRRLRRSTDDRGRHRPPERPHVAGARTGRPGRGGRRIAHPGLAGSPGAGRGHPGRRSSEPALRRSGRRCSTRRGYRPPACAPSTRRWRASRWRAAGFSASSTPNTCRRRGPGRRSPDSAARRTGRPSCTADRRNWVSTPPRSWRSSAMDSEDIAASGARGRGVSADLPDGNGLTATVPVSWFMARQFARPRGLVRPPLPRGDARPRQRAYQCPGVRRDGGRCVGSRPRGRLRRRRSPRCGSRSAVTGGRVEGVELSDPMLGRVRAQDSPERSGRPGAPARRHCGGATLRCRTVRLRVQRRTRSTSGRTFIAGWWSFARVLRPGGRLVLGFGSDEALRRAGYEERGFSLYTAAQIEDRAARERLCAFGAGAARPARSGPRGAFFVSRSERMEDRRAMSSGRVRIDDELSLHYETSGTRDRRRCCWSLAGR